MHIKYNLKYIKYEVYTFYILLILTYISSYITKAILPDPCYSKNLVFKNDK